MIITNNVNVAAGRIDALLSIDQPGRWFTPSQVARKVKTDSVTARSALDSLVRSGWVVSDNRGAWSHYVTASRQA